MPRSSTPQLNEPFYGPPATVHVMAFDGGHPDIAPQWIEVRAREYTFRLAYDPQADPGRVGNGSVVALAGLLAQQLIGGR